jgi:hypothetical protein
VKRARFGKQPAALASQRRFQIGSRGSGTGFAQPLVPARQHGGDEVGRGVHVVVEVQEHPSRRGGELGERAHRSIPVVTARVFHHRRLRAELRGHRHLAHERRTEGVDGLDPQAVGDFLRVRGLVENPLAHLRRRLDGEGDGEDFLGLLHDAEQVDVALHQELGLARARRRLDDE